MPERRLTRVDARRNRERILQIAAQAFAGEGLSVSVQEIARRAGVSTGTVSRHFPTKESLFEAILQQHMNDMIELADRLLRQADSERAFFEFFEATIRAGSENRGFADRLAAAVDERDSLGKRISADVLCDRLETLLNRAQADGFVRADLSLADLEALMEACMSRQDSLDAVIDTIRRGLRPPDA